MNDVNWHNDLENCPANTPILIKFDDGDYRLEDAEENDGAWQRYHPISGPKDPRVSYPVAYAVIESKEAGDG